MKQAALRLASYQTVAAKISQHVDLFGEQLIGNGRYVQGRGGGAVAPWHIDLRFPLDGSTAHYFQTCDGETLWVRRQIGEVIELGKIDVRRVVAAQQASAAAAAAPLTLTIGGLPRLMESLDQSFDFQRGPDTSISKTPMAVLVGTWKPSRLAELLPAFKESVDAGQGIDARRIPENLPDHVVVYLGRNDLFPYRIEYRRTLDGDLSHATVDAAHRAIAVLQLLEVRIDGAIEQDFQYSPGLTPVTDQTDMYVQRFAPSKKP